jgi:uncharacterized protein (TIGR02996 family)
MTDDEAFIRSIVDNPGDDAPRLVYADWLDERDDPRGAYLRAEVEWARTRLIEKARVLKATIPPADAVWFARLSRSPLGVCCDRLSFGEHEPDITRPVLSEGAMGAVERRFAITFGPEYRAFLINHNGGIPQPNTFQLPDGTWKSLYHFHTIWSEDGSAPYDEHDLVERLEQKLADRFWDDPRLRGFVDVGRAEIGDRQWLCLDCGGDSPGTVYLIDLWMDIENPVLKVADSFGELLAMFTHLPTG